MQVYSPLDHCLYPLQRAKGFVQIKVERRQARGVNFEFPPGNEHYRQRGVNFAQTVHDLIAGHALQAQMDKRREQIDRSLKSVRSIHSSKSSTRSWAQNIEQTKGNNPQNYQLFPA